MESLKSLGLVPLERIGSRAGPVRWLAPERALGELFCAACNGGAYSGRLFGAYGRLAAWESFAALAGAGEVDALEAVAERARACRWITFHAASDWYYDIAWDIGLAVLRPDRRSLAVLADTDTD